MARKRQYVQIIQPKKEEKEKEEENRPTTGEIRLSSFNIPRNEEEEGEEWSEDDLTTSSDNENEEDDEEGEEEETQNIENIYKYYYGAPILMFCYDSGPISPLFITAYYFPSGSLLVEDWIAIQRLTGEETSYHASIFSLIYDEESYWNLRHKIPNPSVPSTKKQGIERVSYDPTAQTIILRNITNY